MTLGNVTYTKDECITIMAEGNSNNGLIIVAEQQIAAKLNVLSQAGHDCVDAAIEQVDMIVGDLVVPPFGDGFIPVGNVLGFATELEHYNKGESCCASHCSANGDTPMFQGGPERVDTQFIQLQTQIINSSSVQFLVTAGDGGAHGFVIRAAPLDELGFTSCDETFDILLAPGDHAVVTYGTHGCALNCLGEYQFRARPAENQEWGNRVIIRDFPCSTGPSE